MIFASVSWYSIYPPNTGGRVRIYNMLKHMKTFIPYLISPPPTPSDISSYAISPLPFSKLPFTFNFNPQILNYLFPVTTNKVFMELTRLKPTFIQAEGVWAFPPVYSSSKRIDARSIITVHNIEYITAKRALGDSIKTKFVRQIEQSFYNKANLLIAVSEVDKEQLVELYQLPEEKILVVPNGVDVEAFSEIRQSVKPDYEIEEEDKLIVFVGKLDYKPNKQAVKLIVNEIMPRVREVEQNAKIMIIGSPRPEITEKNIIFTGYVEDIASYLQSAEIAIAPIFAGSGTRLKILEYMAAGLPVVSTSIGAEGLDVTHGKNILIADTVAEFVSAVIGLLNDEAKAKYIGKQGRKLVEEKYDWNNIVRKYEEELWEKLNTEKVFV